MKRKMLAIICVWAVSLLLSGYAAMGSDGGERLQSTERMAVAVDGETAFMGYAIDGIVYVPLRSFCGSLNLGAAVSWDGAADTMTVTMHHGGSDYVVTARVGDFYLYVNDRAVYLGAEIRSRRGNLLVPLDGLSNAFGVTVSEQTADGLQLHTDALQPCAPGSEVYDPDALKWLSHIIHAEAGNQSLEGQICVGNVVLNRVADERFPDTVEAVVFSPNQFCPVKSGTIWCIPDADAVAAAKLCLEGVNLAGESTYFVNPVTGSTAWFRENLQYVMTVGEHEFYY